MTKEATLYAYNKYQFRIICHMKKEGTLYAYNKYYNTSHDIEGSHMTKEGTLYVTSCGSCNLLITRFHVGRS